MTHFLKLQATSILLALVLLINIQLLANSGRLSLWIGNAYVPVIAVTGLTSLGVFSRVAIRQIVQLTPTLWNLSLYLLWLPYLALFTFCWTRVIPAPNEAAWPSPVVGLLIIALTIIFPLYVFIVHMVARSKQPTT
ncbi:MULTISPECIES: hypothetical protein [unclassified Exiguobacterium]|uniref:hypothetical protein n=1 Tax=unclassified Exiguobacterium TaxID=2644629 RepID=UPI0010404787|nr:MULTISPECIES: hypothetical protein [unclassified Exiguobacterium]TCI67952.1 hypothetical protein EVJ19_11745 [Exiguobacterium sp. IPCI3]TCI77370.1 hypothetical protein EVJ18_11740 [Exiguobacterium sp. IPCH1]TCI78848.1 hypothetical protein EVJ17_11740 [Exiguobacterium sp. IPBC4]